MKLLLLRCPNCTNPLAPENNDVVVTCSQCYKAVAIEENGSRLIDVRYAVKSGSAPVTKSWIPLWVYEGRVNIHLRETQGRSRSVEKEVAELWGEPRRLYVPAWDLSLHTAQEVGQRMVQQQPAFQFVNPPEEAQLVPATVTREDALRLLEFVVLAIEARRKDWLKDIQFDLDVGEPELWAVPQGTI